MKQEHKRLIDKSIEAFIMGLEVYNKPTIRYRVEGYEPLTNEQIRMKYSPEVAEKFIQQANEIDVLSSTYDSDKFAINIRQNLYITKKKDEADFKVSIENGSDNKVAIVKELKDPADTHKYTFNTVVTAIREKMAKNNIRIDYEKGFNKYVLKLVMDFYDVKSEPKFAYKHEFGKNERYTYSQQFVDFVFDEIKKNPDKFVESLKQEKR